MIDRRPLVPNPRAAEEWHIKLREPREGENLELVVVGLRFGGDGEFTPPGKTPIPIYLEPQVFDFADYESFAELGAMIDLDESRVAADGTLTLTTGERLLIQDAPIPLGYRDWPCRTEQWYAQQRHDGAEMHGEQRAYTDPVTGIVVVEEYECQPHDWSEAPHGEQVFTHHAYEKTIVYTQEPEPPPGILRPTPEQVVAVGETLTTFEIRQRLRNNLERLGRLIALKAPQIVLDNERRMLGDKAIWIGGRPDGLTPGQLIDLGAVIAGEIAPDPDIVPLY